MSSMGCFLRLNSLKLLDTTLYESRERGFGLNNG